MPSGGTKSGPASDGSGVTREVGGGSCMSRIGVNAALQYRGLSSMAPWPRPGSTSNLTPATKDLLRQNHASPVSGLFAREVGAASTVVPISPGGVGSDAPQAAALQPAEAHWGFVVMRVRIDKDSSSNSGDRNASAQLTADFADWLAQDREVGRHTEIRRIRPKQVDGAMSSDLVEWINLTVSSGFSATALVYAHKNFRNALPPRLRTGMRMVIEHGGVRVVVENGTEEDAVRIAQALAAPVTAQPSADPPSAGGTPPRNAGHADS